MDNMDVHDIRYNMCTINIRYKLIHVQGVLHFLRSLCDSFHIEASRNIKPERERSQDK